jgi:hypothetical protein
MKFLILILLALLSPKVAYAYIDPGSLSIILQVLGSFFVAILVFFRTIKLYLFQIYSKIFLSKKKEK